MPLLDVARAYMEAAAALGALFLGDKERLVARLLATGWHVNPFLVTTAAPGEGEVVFETRIPVHVAPVAETEALRLCLMLSGVGRVGFVLGKDGRPRARTPLLLAAQDREAAVAAVGSALHSTVQRASAATDPFRRVAAGVTAEGALAGVAELDLPRSDPWSERPPTAATWPDLLEKAPEAPGPVPDGWTEPELRASVAVHREIRSMRSDDACWGPILVHADGVIECYGCTDPPRTPHHRGTVGSCATGLRVGDGYICERCA